MNKINIVLILIIIIEFIYVFINDNEMFKEHIDYFYSHEGNINIKVCTSIGIIILLFIIYYITYYIQQKYKINRFILMIFVIITFIIYIECKLSTNIKYSNKCNDIDDILSKCTTGDFLFFRSYHSYDIPELVFYRYLNAILSDTFFGHIGIIIKINNIPYILECTEDYYNCEYSGNNKNGVILHKAYNRIKNYSGRVYLSRNNLDEYITEEDINRFIKKYSNLSFLENNISCVNLIIKLLYECKILKKEFFFMFISEFNNKNIYNINFMNTENIKIKNDYINK